MSEDNTDTLTNPQIESSSPSQTVDIKRTLSNASPPKNNNSNTSDTNITTKKPSVISEDLEGAELMTVGCGKSGGEAYAHAVKRGRKKQLIGKKRCNKSDNTRNVKRQRLNNGTALRKSRRQRAVVSYNEKEENET
eukprot:930219_1